MTSHLTTPGVRLTQISAYISHNNLAVRKIMEAMLAAYAKGGTKWKGAFEIRHSFLYFFSLVYSLFRNFVRKFVVHLRAVCASSQRLARPLPPYSPVISAPVHSKCWRFATETAQGSVQRSQSRGPRSAGGFTGRRGRGKYRGAADCRAAVVPIAVQIPNLT